MAKQNLPRLLVSRTEARKGLQAQIEKGEKLCAQTISSQEELSQAKDDFSNWSIFNETLLKKYYSDISVADSYHSLHTAGDVMNVFDTFQDKLGRYKRKVKKHIKLLIGICDRLELYGEPSDVSQHDAINKGVVEIAGDAISDEVFIVHGRDDGAKDAVALFIRDLDFKEIILEKKPNSGLTIIEKFEQHASDAAFAIALLTPDDVGALREEADNKLKSRARQNVILELGYFLGRLGRRKVCLLIKGELENPSDLDGVLYVPMGNSDDWRMKVAKEMKQAGLSVDMNKLA